MDAKTASKFCGVGLTLFRQLDVVGKVPECVRLNSKKLYVTRQLEAWAINSCPARDTEKWQKILSEIRGADVNK